MGYGSTLMVLNSVRVLTRYRRKLSPWVVRIHGRQTHLEDDSALENNQHECCEQTVVPVLVQAPKGYTENLEHKERRSGMLSK